MTRSMRVMSLLCAASAAATAVQAQIPGMPLFTNPRYATGLRVHADYGQPTSTTTSLGAVTVIQGGVTFALGPLGLGANVGARRNDLNEALNNSCANCNTETAVTASAIGQLRLAGGGRQNLSLSVFGGASMDVKAYEFAGLTATEDSILRALGLIGDGTKVVTIPVGVSVGLRIPLGAASLNLWGAPRMNLTRFTSCPATCPSGDSKFRFAVGADLPILRILSVRAAYDSGKIGNETVSVFGVGASIGVGGMR